MTAPFTLYGVVKTATVSTGVGPIVDLNTDKKIKKLPASFGEKIFEPDPISFGYLIEIEED